MMKVASKIFRKRWPTKADSSLKLGICLPIYRVDCKSKFIIEIHKVIYLISRQDDKIFFFIIFHEPTI